MVLAEIAAGLSFGTPAEIHAGPTNTVLVLEDPHYLDAPGLAPIWISIDLILGVQGFL